MRLRYFINKNLHEHSMKVFEGISNGRKKALDNWFGDKWAQIDNIKNSIVALEDNNCVLNNYLEKLVKEYGEFCEIFILDDKGRVLVSSCEKHIGLNLSHLPNFEAGIKEKRPLMYGPYEDNMTLDTDIKSKQFYDNVTLMFSCICKNNNDEDRVICFRVLNDDMINVIQDEDTHIYKNSGDNYLFMVKSNRGIEPGTAISRSRFEDSTFTLGENLKDGINTKKWGKVQIKEHTEFEITFKDPATNKLHQGVSNTIKNGQNIDCWPGYPDYRHIMVGGKGTIINPPNCDEVWGMMCEGDIEEIYDFTSINLKIPGYISLISGVLLFVTEIIRKVTPDINMVFPFLNWIVISIFSMIVCKKLIESPLSKTLNILQDIAEGEGNLTKRVNKMSTDEVGELSRWFNKFINNQMSMLNRVRKSVKITQNSVGIVSKITRDVKNGMSEIEDTVINLLENSKDQNDVFQTTKDKFANITASIQEMDSLILEISNTIEDTNEVSTNASKSSKSVLDSMEELKSIIRKTVDSIEELQSNSKKITEVINIISDISEQTQLLALNATIEAARAGEEGKGFSVVAGEISKLAIESKNATKSIEDVIKSVQKQTEYTCKYAEQINTKVISSMDNVSISMDAFSKVNDDINVITEAMKSISQVTTEQSTDVSDIMNSITVTAEKVNQNTENNLNKSEESLATVKNILLEIKRLNQASNALEYSADNMEKMVGAFKLS